MKYYTYLPFLDDVHRRAELKMPGLTILGIL